MGQWSVTFFFDKLKITTDGFDMEQLLNNFFTKVATEREAEIPASSINRMNLVPIIEALVFLCPVSTEECVQVILKLRITKTGSNE